MAAPAQVAAGVEASVGWAVVTGGWAEMAGGWADAVAGAAGGVGAGLLSMRQGPRWRRRSML